MNAKHLLPRRGPIRLDTKCLMEKAVVRRDRVQMKMAEIQYRLHMVNSCVD